MRHRKLIIQTSFVIAMLWLKMGTLLAQIPPPPGGGGGGAAGPVGGDAGVPLDGGMLSLLLAGLGILAIRKIKGKRAKERE